LLGGGDFFGHSSNPWRTAGTNAVVLQAQHQDIRMLHPDEALEDAALLALL
jgi:hypothetical protein